MTKSVYEKLEKKLQEKRNKTALKEDISDLMMWLSASALLGGFIVIAL